MNYVEHDPPRVTREGRAIGLSISVGAIPLVERIERQAARIVFLETVVETLQSMLREQDAGMAIVPPLPPTVGDILARAMRAPGY